jgi:hypothetical protein
VWRRNAHHLDIHERSVARSMAGFESRAAAGSDRPQVLGDLGGRLIDFQVSILMVRSSARV